MSEFKTILDGKCLICDTEYYTKLGHACKMGALEEQCKKCNKIYYKDHKDYHTCNVLDSITEENKHSEQWCKMETKSATGALRYNKGKLPMELVPPSSIKAIAAVLDYGASKYARRNWEAGAEYSVPYASLMRHLLAFWEGEDRDPESQLPHTYHILMNAAMLVEYEEKYKELDDRPGKKDE